MLPLCASWKLGFWPLIYLGQDVDENMWNREEVRGGRERLHTYLSNSYSVPKIMN